MDSGSTTSAVLHAAYSGHLDAIRRLVDAGADVGAKNGLNWNGLMQAIVLGHTPTVRYFVEQGLPLDEVDQQLGYTALMLARARSARSVVELLLEHGAQERPVRRPADGETFPMAECDICTWLPDKRDMGDTHNPEPLPYLIEVRRSSERSDRYCFDTRIVLRCPVCATRYEQLHSIDTEDSFISGPSISQHLRRLGTEQQPSAQEGPA